jgi:hypothetical protein
MEIKALFGILSSIVVLIGGFPYIKDIYKRKARPHVLSWLGWGFITSLGALAMLASGSKWVVAILFANSLLCFIIVVFSIVRKVAILSTTKLDYLFFGLGILGLVLWQTLDMPIFAIVCAILADFSFGLPNIIKIYKKPKTETTFIWLTATLSGLLSMFAIEHFTFSQSGYPIYLFIYDTIVLLLVLKVVRKK